MQVAVSRDGSSVVAGVENASLGLLSPQTREYTPLVAAHRGDVLAVSAHTQLRAPDCSQHSLCLPSLCLPVPPPQCFHGDRLCSPYLAARVSGVILVGEVALLLE